MVACQSRAANSSGKLLNFMEPIEGEPSRGDGQQGPEPRNDKKMGGKGPVASGDAPPPRPGGREITGAVIAENQALRKFLQGLAAAILILLSGNLGIAEIFHAFLHDPIVGHKSIPIQSSTRKADRGNAPVEIQDGEGENDTAREDARPTSDSGSATGNHPTSDRTELVSCEAAGVGCKNRVPSGFCHFRKHLCLVAPHPDRQPAEGPWAEILPELRVQRDFLDRLLGGQEKILVQLPLLAEPRLGNPAAEPVSEDVARQAFALLLKLDVDAPQKSPSALRVFRLYCVQGYSADRVADKCQCAKGTVMSRLRFIERVTNTKPEDFRAVSDHLQQIDDEFRASGAREIYRRGLAHGEDS